MKNFFSGFKSKEKIIETERLWIRPWKTNMARDLYEYGRDPEVGPIAGWAPLQSVQEAADKIAKVYIPTDTFAIVYKANNKTIGNIGFQPDRRRFYLRYSKEIGYSLSREYWNHGIMTEALEAFLRYGFEEEKYLMLAICTEESNIRSRRVIEKNGFIYEGLSRWIGTTPDGKPRNEHCFSMKYTEWDELERKRGRRG